MESLKRLKKDSIKNFQQVKKYFEPFSSFIPDSLCAASFNETIHKTNQKLEFERLFMLKVSKEAGKIVREKWDEGENTLEKYLNFMLHSPSSLETLLNQMSKIEAFFLLIEYQPSREEIEHFLEYAKEVEKNLKSILLYKNHMTNEVYSKLKQNDCFFALIDCFLQKNDVTVDIVKSQKITGEESLKAIRLYLNEICEFPLLTRKEEMYLGHQILEGNKEAKQKMIEHNLRLVVPYAKRFTDDSTRLLELIQEGNIGLMHASEKYNWLKGYRFSTYAMLWIRSVIHRYIQVNLRFIKFSEHGYEKLTKMKKYEEQLTIELGRIPSIEELAKKLKWEEKQIIELKKVAQEPHFLEGIAASCFEEEGDLLERIEVEDENILSVEEEVIHKNQKEILKYFLEKLTPEQKDIISLRIGLNGEEKTLKEIGQKYHITRERIRQKEQKAISQLKSFGLANMQAGIYGFFESYEKKVGIPLTPMQKLVLELEQENYEKEEIYHAVVALTDQERTSLLNLYEKCLQRPLNDGEVKLVTEWKAKIKFMIQSRKTKELECTWEKQKTYYL